MRLTRHVDLALRALMYLALQDGRVCTIAEIAAAYDISESHLMKVVHSLGVRGLVHTVRGHGGGLRLAAPPGDIGIGRVVRLLEDDLGLVECFDGRTNTCPIAGACALTGILDEALDAFLGVLDGYSLADLLASRSALLRRLAASGRTLASDRAAPRATARLRTPRHGGAVQPAAYTPGASGPKRASRKRS